MFADIDAHDSSIIDTINHYVQPRDTLYMLGDFAWKASRYGHYRQRLRVKELHVVAGNHDANSLRNYVTSYQDMLYRKIEGHWFHMSHYPMASWRNRTHGSIHLYGHCHGTIEETLHKAFPGRRAMDVGIDHAYMQFGELRPFSLPETLSLLNAT